jgi:hypothetical protein
MPDCVSARFGFDSEFLSVCCFLRLDLFFSLALKAPGR